LKVHFVKGFWQSARAGGDNFFKVCENMSICALLKSPEKSQGDQFYAAGPCIFLDEEKVVYRAVCEKLSTYNIATQQTDSFGVEVPFVQDILVSPKGVYAMLIGKQNARSLYLSTNVHYKPRPLSNIRCMTFSPDGKVIALGLEHNAVALLTHSKSQVKGLNPRYIFCGTPVLAVKYEGDTLVIFCSTGEISGYLENRCVFTDTIRWGYVGPWTFKVRDALFSPTNQLVVFSDSRSHWLHVYDRSAKRIRHSFARYCFGYVAKPNYSFFPDGVHLVFAEKDGHTSINICNAITGARAMIIQHFNCALQKGWRPSISPSGSRIAMSSTDGVTIWNVFDRVWVCGVSMSLIQVGVPVYVVLDIVNLLHATTGNVFVLFDEICKFFGAEKFRLVSSVQEAIHKFRAVNLCNSQVSRSESS
jgi:hypothetical protein